MGEVLCLALASAAALTSHSRCGSYYTLGLYFLMSQAKFSLTKDALFLNLLLPPHFSSDANTRSMFTPPHFLTRTFQAAIVVWIRRLLL